MDAAWPARPSGCRHYGVAARAPARGQRVRNRFSNAPRALEGLRLSAGVGGTCRTIADISDASGHLAEGPAPRRTHLVFRPSGLKQEIFGPSCVRSLDSFEPASVR